MKPTRQRSRIGRAITRGLRIGGVMMLLAGSAVYLCYRADRAVLRRIAKRIVKGVDTPAEKVRAVNTWVHWHEGFVANEQSYLFSRLGATPLQIVDDGGDCADKSRLVVALLSGIDIPATSAMCFYPPTGEAVHTVVEAHLGGEDYIVVDPSFDLFFPKLEHGKYYGLIELRRDPTILASRLDEITSSRNFWMRINGYRREKSVYDLAATFNWNKNLVTRAARAALALAMGDTVYRIRRPRLLEEPELAVACAATLAGLGMISCSAILRRRAGRKEVKNAALAGIATHSAAEMKRCDRSLTRSAQDHRTLESV